MSIEGHANVLLFDFFALKAAPLVYMYRYYCTNYGCVSCTSTAYTADKFVKFGPPFFSPCVPFLGKELRLCKIV